MKAYEESLKTYRDNYSIIESAKKENAIEIAKAMKKDKQSIELILKYTGLSREEIEKL
jgi:predicted transposase YdaD